MKEGKIWNITYEMENIVFTDPNAMEGFKMLGVDFASEKFAHKVGWFRGWNMIRFKLKCAGKTKCSKVWRRNGKVGEHENKIFHEVEYNCLKSKTLSINDILNG